MMKKTAWKGLLCGAIIATAGAHAEISVDKANGQKIFENGKGDVPACSSCHGPDGMGVDSMGTPRLASQQYYFLVKQLEDFASDKRTDTTMFVMNTNAKGLTAKDKRDIAAYLTEWDGDYTAESVAALADAGIKGKTHLGKALVMYGKPESSIPACRACHNYNGRGAAPVYPRIANQRAQYIVNQLTNFRAGKRTNDPMGQMQAVARHMTDDDIANAAVYLTSANIYSPGNATQPEAHQPFHHE